MKTTKGYLTYSGCLKYSGLENTLPNSTIREYVPRGSVIFYNNKRVFIPFLGRKDMLDFLHRYYFEPSGMVATAKTTKQPDNQTTRQS